MQPRLWRVALVAFGISCGERGDVPNPKAERPLHMFGHTSCTDVAPLVIFVHEADFYIPANDPSDQMAQKGAYAQAAIESCTKLVWGEEIRNCVVDRGFNSGRAGVDGCLHKLDAKARADLAAELSRVEAGMRQQASGSASQPVAQPANHLPWLAP